MRLPRAVPADRLIKRLENVGYVIVRQKGSHVRMRHTGPPEHSVTIWLHDALKTGTLHAILAEVAQAQAMTVDDLAEWL